jgi:hypothetical protein
MVDEEMRAGGAGKRNRAARWVGGCALLALFAAPAAASAAQEGEPGAALPASKSSEMLWANVEAGITHVGLATFAMHDLIESSPYWQRSGPLYGAALGVRVDAMTFGVRARHGTSYAFDHWSLGGEAAFRPELGAFVPHVGLGVGYVQVDHVMIVDALDSPDFRFWEPRPIHGIGTRLLGGFDYRFAEVFSAGLAVSGELLFFRRSASAGAPTDSVDSRDGSSTGGAVAATAVLGLHI